MIRESRTRYGKSDLGYLWAIVEPLAQLLIMWWLFTTILVRQPALAASMPVFLVTGILPYNFWQACVKRSATAAQANIPLLTYPQVKVFDVIVSRVLLDAATLLVVTFVFMVGLNLLQGEPLSSWIDHPLQGVFSLLGLLYFALGFSVLSSSLARIFPPWSEIFGYLGRPLWFVSGIFFTLESLPIGPRGVAQLNPIAHMLEWIRSANLPGFESTHYSITFVLASSTVALFIGLFIAWLLKVAGVTDEAD